MVRPVTPPPAEAADDLGVRHKEITSQIADEFGVTRPITYRHLSKSM